MLPLIFCIGRRIRVYALIRAQGHVCIFAYEFEHSQKMKSLLAQGRNQLTLMKSSVLPQMKLNPPIRRRGGFHPTKLDFIVERRFRPPARVDLVENDRFLSESVVFWQGHKDLNCHRLCISLTFVNHLAPFL